jgi:hypothetical protein
VGRGFTLGVPLAVLGLLLPCGRAQESDAIQKAINKGIHFLKNTIDYQGAGRTTLVGLTLLECGVPADDEVVQRIAHLIRNAGVLLDETYPLALAIIFLDRMGDPDDVPLIQAMGVRLLAGQDSAGGWSYVCPGPGQDEVRRLGALQKNRVELRGRRTPPKGAKAKTPKAELPKVDLPPEIQQQLNRLEQQGPLSPGLGPRKRNDNSNTQFAILGLWAAHRHGIPVQKALAEVEKRFRASQNNDGGWGYFVHSPSSATMTCAGLLGLAMAYGIGNEIALRAAQAEPVADGKPTKPKRSEKNAGKDLAVKAGLRRLATAIGVPAGVGGLIVPPKNAEKFYYFLWSLERVAVAYDLKTIGHKDWYAWGSEILLASQADDGTWSGEYGPQIDTCFALLFLKRANLAPDLTASLKGQVTDPGEVALKSGGVGGEGLNKNDAKPAVEPAAPKTTASAKPTPPSADTLTPHAPLSPKPDPDVEAGRLSTQLVQASPEDQGKLLDQFKAGKGVMYTQAIANAIPSLPKAAQGKARDALAERLMRMNSDTLRDKLKDDDAEIRVAAARACAGKMDRTHIPDLVELLKDPKPRVIRSARMALKHLSDGKDFGPAPDAGPAEREKAIAAWKKWIADESRKEGACTSPKR